MAKPGFLIGSIFILAAAAWCSNTMADTLVEYDFDASSLASSDPSTIWQTSDLMGPLPLGINAGQGNPPPTLQLTFGDVGASLAASVAGDDYYSFTVTPDAGTELTYETLSFDFFKTAAAGATVSATLFSSLDGFTVGDEIGAATLAGTGESGAFFAKSIDLSGLAVDITTPVEFRLYLDDGGASNQANLFQLDNILLTGTALAAVPEPGSASIWLLVGVAVAAFAFCRWQKQ